ncbi:NusA-like transcription termination signal-binding factor [Halopiger djelfimassiliensis]|uniref:NusA-like transcription termination signal-binding factor n=1 Tax=Halopiger djelfimassiliensis TaxID=1293047 RepID=UPI00067776A0|nr:NusA-like transcription termination signal-binding factor [Halopiger djelfimassiliensis]
MPVTLDDDARQYLAAFEDVTGVPGQDCLLIGDGTDDATNGSNTDAERLLIVVSSGRMGEAIGPDGRTVTQYQERVGVPVRLVEDADDPEAFVANTLAPAAVYNVTISENDDTVAYVEVAEDDRGVAIGSNGRTIDAARRLAKRHFAIDDIQLL